MMEKLPEFFVAVDDSDELKVWEKLHKIKKVSGNFGVKLNLDLVFGDLEILYRFKNEFAKPLFVDLKMWNGRRTMGVVLQKLAKYEIDMINVYAHADSMLKDVIQIANDNGIIVLGVTVLTHYAGAYCEKLYGKSIGKTVRTLSEMALENGCHGVILPGTTLGEVAHLECIKFNPAVRPLWFENKKINVQEQIMTPREAKKKGATIVSCGSPVFKTPDPAEALARILNEMRNA